MHHHVFTVSHRILSANSTPASPVTSPTNLLFSSFPHPSYSAPAALRKRPRTMSPDRSGEIFTYRLFRNEVVHTRYKSSLLGNLAGQTPAVRNLEREKYQARKRQMIMQRDRREEQQNRFQYTRLVRELKELIAARDRNGGKDDDKEKTEITTPKQTPAVLPAAGTGTGGKTTTTATTSPQNFYNFPDIAPTPFAEAITSTPIKKLACPKVPKFLKSEIPSPQKMSQNGSLVTQDNNNLGDPQTPDRRTAVPGVVDPGRTVAGGGGGYGRNVPGVARQGGRRRPRTIATDRIIELEMGRDGGDGKEETVRKRLRF